MIQIKVLQVILLFSLLAAIFSCKKQTERNPSKENLPKQITEALFKFNFLTASTSLLDYAYGKIIKCGLRDKAGNLWFGTTWQGAFRYDGKTFTHFTEKDGLCSNEVHDIYEDAAGTLWFGTANGVCRYNGKAFINVPLPTGEVSIAILPNQTSKETSSKTVASIMQDKVGNMWFGIWGTPGSAGAYRYDGKNFTHFFPESPLQGIVEDKEGGIWLNSKRYDGKSFTDFSGKEKVFKDQVVKSLKDQAGNLWFGVRENGLYRYDGTSFTYFSAKEGLGDTRVTCIFEDKGGLWLGSDIRFGTVKGGLYRYDGKSFILVPQIYDFGIYSVWTAVEDKNGNIWFGGRGGKLCRYDGKSFTDFSDELK